jgi:hypothetical protein
MITWSLTHDAHKRMGMCISLMTMIVMIVMMIVMIVMIVMILQKHRVIRDFVEHLRKSSASDSTLTRVDLTHAPVWNLDQNIRLRLVTCKASITRETAASLMACAGMVCL